MDPRLLKYYERELRYIREMGSEFAQEYPKIAGRLGLVFPATALGRRQILSNSWTMTIGNGLRLMLALAIPWGIYQLLFWLIEVLSARALPTLMSILAGILALITIAVEIAVLSLAYRHLESADYLPDAG